MTRPTLRYENSWLSLDFILGCPASCEYCYLDEIGLARTKPRLMVKSLAEVISQVEKFPLLSCNVPQTTSFTLPFCVGGLSDMCIRKEEKRLLIDYLMLHRYHFPEHLVTVITKGALSESFLDQVADTGVQVAFLISLAFFEEPNRYERGVTANRIRLGNFEKISRYPNMWAIHNWRPITAINVPTKQAAITQLRLVRDSGAAMSVAMGLVHGNTLELKLARKPESPLSRYFHQHYASSYENEILPSNIRLNVIEAMDEIKDTHPVFMRSTSCAISMLLGTHDYNSTFRKPLRKTRCEASTCPPHQREICGRFRSNNTMPHSELLQKISVELQVPFDAVTYELNDEIILINAPIPQDKLIALSHLTGYLVRSTKPLRSLEWLGSYLPPSSRLRS